MQLYESNIASLLQLNLSNLPNFWESNSECINEITLLITKIWISLIYINYIIKLNYIINPDLSKL